MKKLVLLLILLMISVSAVSQAIHLENRYGKKIFFVEDSSIKSENRYG